MRIAYRANSRFPAELDIVLSVEELGNVNQEFCDLASAFHGMTNMLLTFVHIWEDVEANLSEKVFYDEKHNDPFGCFEELHDAILALKAKCLAGMERLMATVPGNEDEDEDEAEDVDEEGEE